MSAEPIPCYPDNHDQPKDPQQGAEAELLELEAEEENSLCRDPAVVIHGDLRTDEDSGWLHVVIGRLGSNTSQSHWSECGSYDEKYSVQLESTAM
jgi:hypothetical protein